MKDEIKEIKFIEYNGIEGYIELMKQDVKPLNNPDCTKVELYYDGKDIKAVLDYITNLQEKYEEADNDRHKLFEQKEKAIEYIKSLCYIESKNEWFTYGDDLSPEHIVNILNGGDE